MRKLSVALGLLALLLVLPSPAVAFEFLPGQAGAAAALTDGNQLEEQAGAHPGALELTVGFAGTDRLTDGDLRDLSIELPPGLIENPSAVPQCTQAEFHVPRSSPFEESLSGESCPDRSQVGIATIHSSFAGAETRSFGIFNLEPPPGVPSELGFNPYGAPIVFTPSLRQSEGDYGITLRAQDIPQLVDIQSLSLEVWGTPWVSSHDEQRGDCLNEAEAGFGWAKCSVGPPLNNPPVAYLTMPTSCVAPLDYRFTADAWQQPEPIGRTAETPALRHCELSIFAPKPAGRLNNPRASSASGYDFEIAAETQGITNPELIAPSSTKKAVVALPDGVTINPSVGAGLGVCSPTQYGAETVASPPGAGCPNESKIGDFTVRSPLFAEQVEGSIFLAKPFDNPFGTLIGLYLVAKAPQRGILVKVSGKLDADPGSGRLIATFDGLPQLPYSNLDVKFREGQRSPLTSPPSCGTSTTAIDLSPWRDPTFVRHTDSSSTVVAGVNGGPCPVGVPPFAPGALAGSLNSNAGSYSAFYLHLVRQDTEQEITSYSADLPPGLLGRIAGIPYCSDAAIAAARLRSGVDEQNSPSCPAASLIGHTYSGYGLGSVLSYAPGGLYLAGPYRGAPLSVVAVDSALVGPFDLGVVIVRSAIRVNPQTAQVSIDSTGSDPIPHIIDGIPIHLRDIRVYIDRSRFALNPTSCNRFSIASTLSGSGARFSDPADDTSAAAIYNYQAFNCGALGLKPKVAVSLKGGTKRGDYPALKVTVVPRPGDANLASASVALPPTIFLAQNHLRQICTRAQFAREACPASSVYGHVKVFTPLLDEPLEGNVYLRSSGNPLPDLVFAMVWHGIHIDLPGRVDSVHGGMRGTFENLPDAPVSKFVLTMKGGRQSVIVDAANVCASPQLATARMVGQSNQGLRFHPRVQPECRRKGHGRHKQKGGGGR